MSSISQTSKFEKKAFQKQNRRQRKGEIKNKAARKKRQPPTNKPQHTIKKSHKPTAPSSVKNTRSYQDLTWGIEKIHLERERAYEEYYNDIIECYNEEIRQFQQQQEEEQEMRRCEFYKEEERKRSEAKRLKEKAITREKKRKQEKRISEEKMINNLKKDIVIIKENLSKNEFKLYLENFEITIKPI